MVNESALFVDVTFRNTLENFEEGSSATQAVVYATVRDEQFPMVKFTPSNKMYQNGLERHHKPLANMENLACNMAELLEASAKVSHFSEERYNLIISAFNIFTVGHMKYDAILSKVRLAQAGDGWA